MNEFDLSQLGRTAASDQACESARAVARIVSAYFETLTALGLTREEALALTCSYQDNMFRQLGHG